MNALFLKDQQELYLKEAMSFQYVQEHLIVNILLIYLDQVQQLNNLKLYYMYLVLEFQPLLVMLKNDNQQ